jgi:hypothetical protein
LIVLAAKAVESVVDEFDWGVTGVVVPMLGGVAGFVLVLPGEEAAEDGGALIPKAGAAVLYQAWKAFH